MRKRQSVCDGETERERAYLKCLRFTDGRKRLTGSLHEYSRQTPLGTRDPISKSH